MRNEISIPVTGLICCLVNAGQCSSAEIEWGTLKGRVVVEGEIPKLKPSVTKGDPNVRDAACCAAQDIPDVKYLIDPATNGFANVVIYLPKRPTKIHPDFDQPAIAEKANPAANNKDQNADALKEVKFEQKDCQFLPHILIARTGQRIRAVNRDPIAHNFHTNPNKNQPSNFITLPKDDVGVMTPPMTMAERIPFKITDDIHSWMSAYCLVLDHPYWAVTDKTGSFRIPNLSVGKHDFVVWHESTGYVDKQYTVLIEQEMNEMEPLTVEIQ